MNVKKKINKKGKKRNNTKNNLKSEKIKMSLNSQPIFASMYRKSLKNVILNVSETAISL